MLGDVPDVNSGIGIRAGDPGLGVPVSSPRDLAPLTAADRAALESAESAVASRSAGSGGGSSGPIMGGKPSALGRMLKSRGGKAGLGLAALTGLGGAGYGLFGGSEEPPAPPPPPPEAAPAPPSDLAPRQAVRRFAWGNAGKAIGNWWGRMKQTYGA